MVQSSTTVHYTCIYIDIHTLCTSIFIWCLLLYHKHQLLGACTYGCLQQEIMCFMKGSIWCKPSAPIFALYSLVGPCLLWEGVVPWGLSHVCKHIRIVHNHAPTVDCFLLLLDSCIRRYIACNWVFHSVCAKRQKRPAASHVVQFHTYAHFPQSKKMADLL